MPPTLDKRHGNSNPLQVYSVGPDQKEEYWIGNNYVADYPMLRWSGYIPPGTAPGGEKDAIRRRTGAEEPRFGKLDAASERLYDECRSKYNKLSILEVRAAKRAGADEEKLKSLETYLEKYPERRWAEGVKFAGRYRLSLNISQRDRDSPDLRATINTLTDKKFLKGMEEASRNVQLYEETSAEVTFKTSEKRIADLTSEFFKGGVLE